MSNLVAPNTVYRLKGDGDAWGWNAGALFTLSPAMRVGISYRSAIQHKPEGSRAVGATSTSAKAELTLPDTFILSVWQQVSDRWEAMGDLSYSNWSQLDKVKITYATGAESESFNYKDSWRIAWGAAYRATDTTKLKFGVAYDTTPTTNNDRSARVPDNDRVWFSLGGQWNAGNLGKFDLGYSYIYLKDPSVNQTKTLAGGTTSTLRGRYDDSAHVVGLQYSVGF
jgi:long-chain fatty acid transport protein